MLNLICIASLCEKKGFTIIQLNSVRVFCRNPLFSFRPSNIRSLYTVAYDIMASTFLGVTRTNDIHRTWPFFMVRVMCTIQEGSPRRRRIANCNDNTTLASMKELKGSKNLLLLHQACWIAKFWRHVQSLLRVKKCTAYNLHLGEMCFNHV